MQHPPYPLSRRARRTIMLCLIAVFFILSPVIIFYTAGYRYHLGNGISKTGSLSVDAIPGDAQIYLNDVEIEKELRFDNRASIRQSNLAEGTYRIRIYGDEYLPWEQAVSVHDNQTTYLRDITLLKRAEPMLSLTTSTENTERYIQVDDQIFLIEPSGTSTVAIAPTSGVWFMINREAGWFYDNGEGILTLEGTTDDTEIGTEVPIERILYGSTDELVLRTKRKTIDYLVRGDEAWTVHEWPLHDFFLLEEDFYTRIFFTPWEIWTARKGEEPMLRYRTSRPISGVRQLDRFGVLLIAEQHTLIVYDPRYLMSHELAVFDTIEKFELNKNARIITIHGVYRGEKGVFTLEY